MNEQELKFRQALNRQKFNRECGVYKVIRTRTCYICYNILGKELGRFSLETGKKHWPLAVFVDEVL